MDEVVRDPVNNRTSTVVVCPSCGFLAESEGVRHGAADRLAYTANSIELRLSAVTLAKIFVLMLFAYALISRLTRQDV